MTIQSLPSFFPKAALLPLGVYLPLGLGPLPSLGMLPTLDPSAPQGPLLALSLPILHLPHALSPTVLPVTPSGDAQARVLTQASFQVVDISTWLFKRL